MTGWWLVQCPTGVTGWVSFDSVNIIGDTSIVPLFTVGSQPAPPPAPPQPAPTNTWRATYFANKDFAGSPVLVQDVPDVNFNWGFGSPGPSVPVDYFSARYERIMALVPGSYLLTLRMDDGARLFIDDQLVLDDWRVGSARELSAVRTLGSSARLRIDYFEETGEASIFFAMTPMGVPPPALPTPPAMAVAGDGPAGCSRPMARAVLQQHRPRRQSGSGDVPAAWVVPFGSAIGEWVHRPPVSVLISGRRATKVAFTLPRGIMISLPFLTTVCASTSTTSCSSMPGMMATMTAVTALTRSARAGTRYAWSITNAQGTQTCGCGGHLRAAGSRSPGQFHRRLRHTNSCFDSPVIGKTAHKDQKQEGKQQDF